MTTLIPDPAQDAISNHPRWSSLAGILAGAVSVTLLWIAVGRTSAWAIFTLVAAGGLLGAIALLIAGQLLRGRPDLLRLSIGFGVSGVALVAGGVWRSWGLLAAAGLVLAMLSILAAYEILAHRTAGEPRGLLLVGIALLAAGVGVATRASEIVTLVGVVVWLVGLVLYKLGVPARLRSVDEVDGAAWNRRVAGRGRRTLGASLIVVVAGVALLVFEPLREPFGDGLLVYAVAFTLVIVGLSTCGIASLHVMPDDTWNVDGNPAQAGTGWASSLWIATLLVGVALVAGSWAWTGLHVLPGWSALLIVVCGVPVALGAFFVFRGEGLVALVLFGFLLVWVLADRQQEAAQVPSETSDGIVVVLGDSFSSGQGAERFLPLTNTQGDDGNTCRRSRRSFGQLVGARLNRVVVNYACSGAETADIVRRGQKDNSETSQVPGGLAQLASLTDPRYGVDVGEVDLVLVSIGGNDVGFATVVAACVLPSDCDTATSQWRARVELIGDDLRSTYEAIRAVPGLRPEVPIVVVPYPNYVGDTQCDRSLTDDELRFAALFVGDINAAIADAVDTTTAENVLYFPELDRAYAGRRICDTPRGANFIQLLPPGGPLAERLNPANWHEGTMHPNELGHECTAVALLDWFERSAPDLAPSVPPQAPAPSCALGSAEAVPVRPAPSTDSMFMTVGDRRCVKGTDEISDAQGCFDGDAWVSLRLRETVRQLTIPLSLLLVGGLLIALALTRIRPSVLRPLLVDPPARIPISRAERAPQLYD